MEPFVHALLSNAVMATVLAVGIALVARVIRRPALLHSLCLLGLLKLVTPPVLSLPLAVLVSGSVDRQMVVEDSTLEALSDVAVAEVSHESARIGCSRRCGLFAFRGCCAISSPYATSGAPIPTGWPSGWG